MEASAMFRLQKFAGLLSCIALVGLCCRCSIIDTEDKKRPTILLLVLDTTRADHIGCYGAEGNPTPTIDSLAANGVRFTHAISQSSWTKPSFASLLTGIYPYHINETLIKIESISITITEVLQDAGYFTIDVAKICFRIT